MEKRTRHFAAVTCLIAGTVLYTQLPASPPSGPEATPSTSSGLGPSTSSGLRPSTSSGHGSGSAADIGRVPLSIAGWVGRDVAIDENAFTILTRDADDWIVREYRRDGEIMWLSMVMTRDQRKLFRVHIPDICLPAQGWSVVDRNLQAVLVGPQGSVTATRLIAQKGDTQSQILYWFTSNNRTVQSKMLHRLFLVWDGVMGERTPGTLIQVSAPVQGGDWEDTLHRQAQFIQMMSPYFPQIHGLRQNIAESSLQIP